MDTQKLFARILDGVSGPNPTAGIRIAAKYDPAQGEGAKIYPPTFPVDRPRKDFKRYLTEKRLLATHESGELTKTLTVLTDSVQSEANRWEEAVQDAIDAGDISLPVIDLVINYDGRDHHITNLVAPHRAVDAYFRDAELDGKSWEETPGGKAIVSATSRSARALFEQVPSDLITGHWDSQRGTQRSRKVPRAYSSEMFGVNPQPGRSAAVRVDPFEISSGIKISLPKDGKPGDWGLSTDGKGSKPSEINLGNAISTDTGDLKKARAWVGTSVRHVERIAFISFAALRRLSFPLGGEPADHAVDAAARAVLVALALYGDRRAFAGGGIFLRSGCDLLLRSETVALVGAQGMHELLEIDPDRAKALFEHAVAHAATLGLAFNSSIQLAPKKKLADLIEQSMRSLRTEDDIEGVDPK
jgi:CRISPR-associated protein Csb1